MSIFFAPILIKLIEALPSLLLLLYGSISYRKYGKLLNNINNLGYKVCDIDNINNLRLYFVIPLYLFIFGLSSIFLDIKKYEFIPNLVIVLLSIAIIVFCEIRIYLYQKHAGLYSKAVFISNTIEYFDTIPEIKILEDWKIEYLSSNGVRKVLQLNNYGIEFLRGIFEFKDNVYTNEKWKIM